MTTAALDKAPSTRKETAGAAAQGEAEMLRVGALAPEAALGSLKTHERGLEPHEVEERAAQWGQNVVGKAKHQGFFGELYDRIKNPLVIQLLVIAIVSLAMGDVRSAV